MWRRSNNSTPGAQDEVPEYWITYSDLIVSLLMMFALLLFLVLAKSQADIARVADIRDRVEDAVEDAAAQASNAGLAITVSNGALIIDEDVLFGFGSSVLSADGRGVVEQLAAGFFPTYLASSRLDVNSMVEAIEIEGHTDTIGSYMYNLSLSQRRANAVMAGLLDLSAPTTRDRLRQLLVASGRSETQPVRASDGRIDLDRSRRIEIHFRLRNDLLLDSLKTLIGHTRSR